MNRHVLEYDRAAVRQIEHLYTAYTGKHFELLLEIATTMPDWRFADYWAGWLRFMCAEVLLDREREHQ